MDRTGQHGPLRAGGPRGWKAAAALAVLLAFVPATGAQAVNNPPVLALGDDVTAPGHGGQVVLPGWASFDPGGLLELGQEMTVSVDEVGDPSLFDDGPHLALNGTLWFTPHPGSYGSSSVLVSLTDSEVGSTTVTDSFSIEVTDAIPIAALQVPIDALPHSPAQFFGDASDDGSIVSWLWDFGDGSGSADQHPAHAYARSGEYQVTLDVTDDAGQSDQAVASVAVSAAPLQAGFVLARRIAAGETILLEDRSTGGEGVLTAAWDFGDGESATGTNASHAWADPGKVVVSLNVSDEGGNWSVVTANTTLYRLTGAPFDVSSGSDVTFSTPEVDVILTPPAGSPVGFIDYTFAISALLSGIPNDAVPPLDSGSRRSLLYVEGLQGALHDPGVLDTVQLVFHYDGLAAAQQLQVWYFTGADWVRVPRDPTPLTVPCICPEGDQTFYGYVVDTGAKTLTVTVAHASVFGLAAGTGGSGGALPPVETEAPAAPAAPAPDPDASVPPAAPAAPADPAAVPGNGHLALVLTDGRPVTDGAVLGPADAIRLAWSDPGAKDVRFVLVDPQGRRHPLEGDSWSSEGWPGGAYRIEAVRDAPGGEVTLDSVAVHVAPATGRGNVPLETAAKAVGVSLAVLAGASVLSAAATSLGMAASQAASDTAAAMAEERFYQSRLARLLNWMRRLRPSPVVATLLALGLVAVLFAAADAGSLTGVPGFLWSVGVPTLVLFAACYALDWLIARACGITARLRILGPGTLALIVSTLGFRTPVGNPALVDGDEAEGASGPSDAARAWASLLGYLSFAGPAWLAGQVWGAEAASVGYWAIVAVLVTASLPVAPMTGSSLWHSRKSVALLVWGGCVALYIAYTVGWVTDQHVVWLGLAALPAFTILLGSFALSRRSPQPAWFAASAHLMADIGTVFLAFIPRPLRRLATAMGSAWDAAQAHAGAALRRGMARAFGLGGRASAADGGDQGSAGALR